MSDDVKPENVFVIGAENIERTEMDEPFSVDFVVSDTQGNILRLGNSIYFLKYWSDEVVLRANDVIQKALLTEAKDRGWEIKE